MKELKILLFLIGYLNMSSIANVNISNDLEVIKLKGRVKSVLTIYYSGVEKFGEFQKEKSQKSTFVQYNTFGYEVDNIVIFLGEESSKNKYINDINGKKVESKDFTYGQLSGTTTYKYDNNGRLIETKGFNLQGEILSVIIYKYDSRGNNTEKEFYNFRGNLDFKRISKYDDSGNMIDSRKYSSDGSLLEKALYKYDDNNNAIETSEVYLEKGFTRKFTTLYIYDQYGNWIEEKDFKNGIQQNLTERKIEYFK